jgi:putative oxidoreductase
MSFINDCAPWVLRACLVVLFPFSALDKILNWESAWKQASSMPCPRLLLVISIGVEIVMPLCIVTGWHDRLAAFILGGFCVLTAVLFHQFWRFAGFWRFEEGEGLQHFWEFLKNFGLAGGLGFVMLVTRTLPLDEFVRHPLESTHVSGAAAGSPVGAEGSSTSKSR